MSPDIVTQLLAEKPLIVLVGTSSSLRISVMKMLEKYDFEVVATVEESALRQAYKIIWLLTDGAVSASNYQYNRSILHPFQEKVTILTPIITGIRAPIDDVYHRWELAVQRQKVLITDCNYYFPRANFIFGQDVYSAQSEFQPLYYFSIGIKNSGKLFDPQIPLSLQSEHDYVDGIENYLFRPQTNISTVVKGKAYDSSTIIEMITRKYDAYHQSNLIVVPNAVQTQQNLPFSPLVEEVTADLQRLLHAYIQTVPRYQPPPPPASSQQNLVRPHISQTTSSALPLTSPPVPPPPAMIAPPEQPTPPPAPTPTPVPAQPLVAATKTMQLPPVRPIQPPQPKSPSPQPIFVPVTPKTFSTPLAPAPKEPEDLKLGQELERIFQTPRKSRAVSRIVHAAQKHHSLQRKTKRKKTLFYVGLGFIGSGLGVLFLIGFFLFSQFWVRSALYAVLAEQIVTAESIPETSLKAISASSLKNLERATQVLKIQTQSYGALADVQAISQASVLVDVGEQTAQTISQTQKINNLTTQVLLAIFGVGNQETAALISTLNSEVQKAYETISLLQAGIDQEVLSDQGESEEHVKAFKNSLSILSKSMSIEQQLQPILPALVGVEGRKTYAVLLQNNQELRPTGGFIQAVGFLTFERGSLINTQVMSVYALDSRLSGAVTPPEDLKKYLGETNWFLRDSNWDPHFPDSAARAAWFIENSQGVKVDGVIAINLQTVKELLAATGPLDLPTFNEVITDKNVFERMEFHSEAVLVNSAQANDYSVVFFDALLKKMTTLPSEKILPLLSTLTEQLSAGEMQITLLNDSYHKTIASLGWVGALLSPDCPSRLGTITCQVASIAQIEANVGVNKANYYLERSITHDVTVSHKLAHHHRVITYKNTASSNAWPKGPYKAYIRFYIDEDADVQSVIFNGEKLTAAQLQTSSAHGKKVVAFEINVPIQETRVLELEYLTPLPEGGEFSFALFNQQQSGFGDSPLQVRFALADGISPSIVAPTAQVVGNTITFDKKQDGHGFFGVMVR